MALEASRRGRKKPAKNPSELERVYEALQTKVEKPTPPFNPQQHKDETRANIALFFVKGFFSMTGICLILIPLYNIWAFKTGLEVLSLKDMLTAVSGLISGPLGFVIGHYFKSDR